LQTIFRAKGALAFVLLLFLPLALQAQTSREKALRTVLLFNIAQLSQWPKTAFASDSEPFVIGVVGQDPFGAALEATVHDELVRGRKIKIERYENADAIKKPHLLYISSSENHSLPDVLRQVQDFPTL